MGDEEYRRRKPPRPVHREELVPGQTIDFYAGEKYQKDAIVKLNIESLASFKTHFHFKLPVVRCPLFAPKLAYKVADYEDLNKEFKSCANAMIAYYGTGKGAPTGPRRKKEAQTGSRKKTEHDNIAHMETRITIKDWLLFVGLDTSKLRDILRDDMMIEDEEFITIKYDDIEKLLHYFKELPDFELSYLKQERTRHRHNLFRGDADDYICKHVDGTGKIWYVRKDVDLPWFIPVYSNFFNSKAVDPEWATAEEMILQGRMFEGNEKVYDLKDDNTSLHSFFMKMRNMSEKLVPREMRQLSYIQMFSYGNLFYYSKTHNDLRILHTNHVGYSLFLFFPKSEVEQNLEKTWIPFGATICEFAGEIRPLDLSVPSRVEMDYSYIRGAGETYFVITNKYDAETRPGIGSCAFFANSTCQLYNERVNFTSSESKIFTSKSTVIKDQSFLEKFISISAEKNITGNDIKTWNDENRKHFLSWFNADCVEVDEWVFPVEFLYERDSKKTRREFEMGNTMCQCLTSCSGKIPEFRGRLKLFSDEDLIPREKGDPKQKIREHKQKSDAMRYANTTFNYFDKYMEQYTT